MRYILDIENSLEFNMHPSYLEWEVVKKQILIQLGRLDWSLRFCISFMFSDDAIIAGPGITL